MTETSCPIAGAPGLSDARAQDYDRRWLLVDDQDAWLSAREEPRLAELQLDVRFGHLVIRAPGMLRLDLMLDVIEDDESVERTAHIGTQPVRVVDEGRLACAWFSDWLGRPCRLVKVHPEASPFEWPA